MESAKLQIIQEYVKNSKGWKPSELKADYIAMREGYRESSQSGYHNQKQIQAYVFTRLPATYAVISKLIKQHLSEQSIKTVLDWGCGVGTASLVVSDYHENIACFLIEQDKYALELAQEFFKATCPNVTVNTTMPNEQVDLGIMSYSLNELGKNWQKYIEEVWAKCETLLIVDPGTHIAFNNLLKVRNWLIGKGATVISPCTHAKKCPLENTDDWCHFQERVQRTKEMRFFKNAEKSFENEAYCYLLVSKKEDLVNNSLGRIIAEPRVHGGHVQLKVCKADGEIENTIISKKHENYRRIKKLNWGDEI